MLRKINLIWIFLLFSSNGFCQCYEEFYYEKPEINPQNFVRLNRISEIRNSENEFIISMDTSDIIPDTIRTFTNELNDFMVIELDSLNFMNIYLKDLKTQKLYYITTSKYFGNIDNKRTYNPYTILKNCFIITHQLPNKKEETIVFDLTLLTSFKTDFSLGHNIGFDDTCVYIQPYDFKYKRKKYKYGTIISLNENGVNIIKPIYKKNIQEKESYAFYSSAFKVKSTFSYTKESDCFKTSIYHTEVLYKDKIIDTFETESDFSFRGFNYYLLNDTLEFWSGGNYKKFFQNNLIETRLASEIPVKEKILGIQYWEEKFMGNYRVVKVNFGVENELGLKIIDEEKYTLNGIPYTENTSFHVLVLYDISNNTFLGYPKIEFLSK